jgi:spermidine synthase
VVVRAASPEESDTVTDAVAEAPDRTGEALETLTATRRTVLLVSVLIVALCGIVYELIIATISSYLLGDSVLQFSVTIGLFMFAMGIGSYLTRLVGDRLIERFVAVELAIAFVGGISSVLLFVVFPHVIWYRPVMYGLIIAVGTLVGLEIPILARVLSETGGIRKSIADVLALDYFGALLGAVGFPLLLLPMLGLFRASFSIGLLNGLVALVNIFAFASLLRRPRIWFASVATLLVLLVCAVLSAGSILRFAEGQLYTDRIVHTEQSPYQRIVVTLNERTGRHRLYLDGHLQFAELDEYRYHEALVHPVLSLPGRRTRVLVLGGGDGLAAREILKYGDVASIDIVDIDPAITRFCATFPPIRRLSGGSLDHDRVTVHNADAFSWLREGNDLFDRVIIDLPDPHNEALSKLYSREFYTLLRRRMADDSYFVTQSSSPWLTRRTFWAIAETIRATGVATLSYHVTVPTFGVWGFHIGAATGEVPREFPIAEDKTRFLTATILAGAVEFAKDMAPLEGEVNSIFEPTLYLTYQKEVTR